MYSQMLRTLQQELEDHQRYVPKTAAGICHNYVGERILEQHAA